MFYLNLDVNAASIFKQMAEHWEKKLEAELIVARRKEQSMAIQNLTLDLREVDKMLNCIGRARRTRDPKPEETTVTRPKYAIRDDIVDA